MLKGAHARCHRYCQFPDYNWDLTLKQTLIRSTVGGGGGGDGIGVWHYLCGDQDYAAHLGTIGKGMTFGRALPEEELMRRLIKAEHAFYDRTDGASLQGTREGSLHGLHSGLGGWAPVHAKHCLEVATMHGYE